LTLIPGFPFRIGRVAVDDLGHRAADGDRIEERNLGLRARAARNRQNTSIDSNLDQYFIGSPPCCSDDSLGQALAAA
jgi:hypothetical protein